MTGYPKQSESKTLANNDPNITDYCESRVTVSRGNGWLFRSFRTNRFACYGAV